VANEAADFTSMRIHVAAENASGSGSRLVEAEQSIEEGGLPRPVRSQQTDGPAGEGGSQVLEDGARAEAHLEAIQLYDRFHHFIRTQPSGQLYRVTRRLKRVAV